LLPASASLTVTTATDGFAGTGQDVEVVVEGLEPQEPVSVTAADASAEGTADTDGRVEVELTMPSAAGRVTIAAQGGSPDRTGSTTVEVLAPATFGVEAPASVEAGQTFSVDVDGLVDGEGYEATFGRAGGAGDAAPAARALPSGSIGTLATLAVSGVVAPEQPGEYTLSVVSTVPGRSGSTTVTVLAAGAGVDPGSGDGGSAGTGSVDTGSRLPSTGTSVSLGVLALAVLAVLVGGAMTLRRRRAGGEA
jgi:LPXTG-motif cell wall-anchored protein